MASIYMCGGVEESLCQRNRYSENEQVDYCAQNSQRTLTRCRAMEEAEKGASGCFVFRYSLLCR